MKKLTVFPLFILVIFVNAQNIFPTSGNVGIGTSTPSEKLYIKDGAIIINRNTTGFVNNFNDIKAIWLNAPTQITSELGIGFSANGGGASAIGFSRGGSWDTYIKFYTNSYSNNGNNAMVERMRIDANGNMGIGITNPVERLAVNGKIRAKEIKVETGNWPDYVFSNRYQLKPLPEIEKFIQTNGHLPEVPSAKLVEKEGLELGANQAILLKKIEELTLYIIEQDKKQTQTEQTLTEIQKTNAKLVSEIKLLKKH